MKITTISICLLLGSLSWGQSPDVSPGTNQALVTLTPAYINELAEEMRQKHPSLAAAAARTNAARANAGSVRTWEDPMVELGGMAAERMMRQEDGDVVYGVEQQLPLFGKPGAARRVASAELATEVANADYVFQTLRRDLAKAAFQTGLAVEEIELAKQDVAWLGTLAATVESKYRAGAGTLTEVLQVQNERAKRATQIRTDEDKLVHQHFTLNRFLNRKSESPWPAFQLPPLAGPVPYNEKIAGFAMRYEPKLSVMKREIAAAEAMVDQTRRERYPDISLGLEGRSYSGDGEFRQAMLGVRMNIPWFNRGKYRQAINRDRHKVEALRHDLANEQEALREEVHLLTVRIAAARREALLYQNEIIPRSESSLASARSNWESGAGMFREVLEARRMLVEARLMQARAVAEQYVMLSELVLCCGLGDLEALQMLAEDGDQTTKP